MLLKWILALGLVSLSGCRPIRSESELYGHYELTSRDAKILLDVAADHTYSEKIMFSGGFQQTQTGNWRWMGGQVFLAAFLEPEKLRSEVYEDLPLKQRPKTVGGSYQIDDCLPASWIYGKTVLEIDPDSSENFVKLKASTIRQ